MARSGSARDIAAPDFATTPLWWLDAPPDAAAGDPLPERVDVAVIGTGYCGLSSALELARAGTRVAALDQGALGAGASSRNGGMVGGAVRLDWQDLARRFGRERAAALADGARGSFQHLESLIARERLDAACQRAQAKAVPSDRGHPKARGGSRRRPSHPSGRCRSRSATGRPACARDSAAALRHYAPESVKHQPAKR
jgi:glycine/D-amino acid oxidase-like deaminating enzyme